MDIFVVGVIVIWTAVMRSVVVLLCCTVWAHCSALMRGGMDGMEVVGELEVLCGRCGEVWGLCVDVISRNVMWRGGGGGCGGDVGVKQIVRIVAILIVGGVCQQTAPPGQAHITT